MKKLTFLVLTLFMLSATALAGGDVVTCTSYDDNGIASGIYKSWDIKSDGSYVYILYSQDKTITQKLSLYVDKKNSSGTYIAYATEDFTYDPKTDRKKFAVYDYKFTEAGEYRISVMGNNSDELATTYTTIFFAKEEASEANKKKMGGAVDGDETDTYYYEDSYIVFAESFDDNAVATGESDEFRLKNGQCEFFAKLEQDDDLKITQLIVDVYGGTDYKEEISSETFDIPSKTWNWIKVPIKVSKKGKYVVDMYTENDVYVNSAYFEVK